MCIKQVPGITEVKIDKKSGLLVREGIPSIINPVDKHAIELALNLKENFDVKTIALSMGPPQAEEALREALAMGIDEAYLLSDRKFAGADTLATSYTLSLGIKSILKKYNETKNFLIICGVQAVDGDTGQVGPEIAEELNIAHITNVQKIDVYPNKIIAESVFRSEETVILETKFPVLITVLKELNIPRFPTISGIVDAYDKKIVGRLDAKILGVQNDRIGLDGSQTQVWKIFIPEQKGDHIKLSGSIEDMVKELCQKLKEDKIC